MNQLELLFRTTLVREGTDRYIHCRELWVVSLENPNGGVEYRIKSFFFIFISFSKIVKKRCFCLNWLKFLLHILKDRPFFIESC